MKKFDNILLASDIDGTFTWNFSVTSPRNYEMIEYFKDNGGKFTFSSGRNSKDIYYMIDDLDSVVNFPCILCNGTMLYDVKNKTIENPYYLDEKGSVDIIGFIRENYPHIGIRASSADGFCVCDDDNFIINELTKNNFMDFVQVLPYSKITGKGFFKCVFRGTKEQLSSIYPILESKFPMFTFTRSLDTIIELLPKGISKATQLSYIKDKCKKEGSNLTIACIGDYDNDIDMLKYADISICPENAVSTVKDICKVHVCHCKDGAVADAIEYLDKNYKN